MAKIRRKVGGPVPTAERGTMRVHGLAAALAPLAPDVAATTQMIRHWTREGMLFPVQHSHSGPGKHREYAPDAVYESALLYAFNDMGLPISGSRALLDAVTMARIEVAQRRAGKGKKKPRLVVVWTPAGMATVGVYGEGEKIEDRRGFKAADVVVTIDIDLEKLFARVDGHGRS
jgi:DNA-binding transcriptional MerR regulator